MTSHVLSPEGEWIGFEDFDPAAVEVLRDLIGSNACSCATTMTCTNEKCQGAALTAPGADDDLPGGVASA